MKINSGLEAVAAYAAMKRIAEITILDAITDTSYEHYINSLESKLINEAKNAYSDKLSYEKEKEMSDASILSIRNFFSEIRLKCSKIY